MRAHYKPARAGSLAAHLLIHVVCPASCHRFCSSQLPAASLYAGQQAQYLLNSNCGSSSLMAPPPVPGAAPAAPVPGGASLRPEPPAPGSMEARGVEEEEDLLLTTTASLLPYDIEEMSGYVRQLSGLQQSSPAPPTLLSSPAPAAAVVYIDLTMA